MLLFDMSVSITHDSRLLALHVLKYVLVSHGFTNICHGYQRTYLYINSVTEEQRQSVTGTDGVTESYTYDVNGQRVTRTRPLIGGGSVTTLYFGTHEEDVGSQTAMRTFYSFGGTVIQRSAVTVNGSTTKTIAYLHGDQLGNIGLTTDASGGVISQQNYDAWGKMRGALGGISPTTINYTGQQRDDTGLLFYNARYYDPVIGRFLSADTIGIGKDSQSRNRYTYVGNNPINATDPSGHCTKDREGEVDPDCDAAARQADVANGGTGTGWLYILLKNSPIWGTNEINDLTTWLKLGFRIRSDGTSIKPKEVESIREALDRIYNCFVHLYPSYSRTDVLSLMSRAFGLVGGRTLTFLIGTQEGANTGGHTCATPAYGSCSGIAPNTIVLYQANDIDTYFTRSIQLIIHELGHVLDFNANHGDYNCNCTSNWSDASGSDWLNFHKVINGAVAGAGVSTPGNAYSEDFATTFAYEVQENDKPGTWINDDPNVYNQPGNPPNFGGPDDNRVCAIVYEAIGSLNSR